MSDLISVFVVIGRIPADQSTSALSLLATAAVALAHAGMSRCHLVPSIDRRAAGAPRLVHISSSLTYVLSNEVGMSTDSYRKQLGSRMLGGDVLRQPHFAWHDERKQREEQHIEI